MKINMKNPNTNRLINTKVGFSWTVFFFGFFPALFRSDWKWAAIMFLVSIVTLGFSNIVFAFIYNKLYITDLIGKGFVPADDMSNNTLQAKGYLVA